MRKERRRGSGKQSGARLPWTPQEQETFLSLCGDMPWPLVVQSYQRWAQTRGLPIRTEIALRRRADTLKIRRTSTGEWITTGTIATYLGISSGSVLRWIEQGWLPARRFGESCAYRHYVKRSELRRLARKRPYLFGGRHLATLVELLDHEGLAKQLHENHTRLPWARKPVICVTTGERFPSICAAAKRAFVTPQRMQMAISTGGTANGRRWRAAA